MFNQSSSLTNGLSLEEVLENLKNSSEVDGVLVMGSGGNNTLLPHSDYDLVVVVDKIPVPVFSVFTYIDNRMTDVFFFTLDQLDSLIAKDSLDADDIDGKLLSWLQNGTIHTDKSGKLKQLKEKLVNSNVLKIPESKKYAAWFGINFNFAHNIRYFESNDTLYLNALDIRLLYCVADIISGYFTIRDIPWRGEKVAIKWLGENDSEFLKLFQKYSSTGERNEKVEIYTQLVEKAIEPFGKTWNKNFTGITLKDDFSLANLDEGVKFWDNLVLSK